MQVGQLLKAPAADRGLAPAESRETEIELSRWLDGLREQLTTVLSGYVRDRCAEYVHDVPGAGFLTELLADFVIGGKYVRSTFCYLGWLSGEAHPDPAAALAGPAAGGHGTAIVRAAASTELLHAFALLQDDVMDQSALRRGRPAVHLRLADWHRAQGLDGPAGRFGESASILLADLCLVWAGQLLRDSGLPAAALARGWPRYDTMRGELAVGQFADLVNDARRQPSLDEVLDVARRKSGNYTVRRPLELGAALAGAGERTLGVLGAYGELVGEAFQLRDDVLGVFGRPEVTGKPSGGDLREHKATSIVVLAAELATPAQRAELDRLSRREVLDDSDVSRWRQLIVDTGATARIEQLIAGRVSAARQRLAGSGLPGFVAGALGELAVRYTDRAR
jgi:geranylgeranyl diphosphate synthase type I